MLCLLCMRLPCSVRRPQCHHHVLSRMHVRPCEQVAPGHGASMQFVPSTQPPPLPPHLYACMHVPCMHGRQVHECLHAWQRQPTPTATALHTRLAPMHSLKTAAYVRLRMDGCWQREHYHCYAREGRPKPRTHAAARASLHATQTDGLINYCDGRSAVAAPCVAERWLQTGLQASDSA